MQQCYTKEDHEDGTLTISFFILFYKTHHILVGGQVFITKIKFNLHNNEKEFHKYHLDIMRSSSFRINQHLNTPIGKRKHKPYATQTFIDEARRLPKNAYLFSPIK